MSSSTLGMGVLVFLSFLATEASMAVTGALPREETSRASKDLALTHAVTAAEADITLRRFKAAQLSEEEGIAFLKRVEKIRQELSGKTAKD